MLAVDQAFSYAKARRVLVGRGRALRHEKRLEWYVLRRASGKRLHEAVTQEERNASMGHTLGDSSTYVKYFITEYLSLNFHAIVFGSRPQKDIIDQSRAISPLTELWHVIFLLCHGRRTRSKSPNPAPRKAPAKGRTMTVVRRPRATKAQTQKQSDETSTRHDTAAGDQESPAVRRPEAVVEDVFGDMTMDRVMEPLGERPEDRAIVSNLQPQAPRLSDITLGYVEHAETVALADMGAGMISIADIEDVPIACVETMTIADSEPWPPLDLRMEDTAAIAGLDPPAHRPDDTAILDPSSQHARSNSTAAIASLTAISDTGDMITPDLMKGTTSDSAGFELWDTTSEPGVDMLISTTMTRPLTCSFCGYDADADDPGEHMCDEILEGDARQVPVRGRHFSSDMRGL
ncbi:hypothetical protein AYL99_12114 [Fonsecaea erecta]|uniref:Uncharacterized protein n=1 Tax=Fonsecaea erecta TaxID=1367422 RepID=A0A178Z1N1_9EURO|nr:hypothetical protein AYL99_12114 [Fonsecaea erecta]OAP53708.1 hypothetical protein AYL99_12114 [Fonsecaea erecta]